MGVDDSEQHARVLDGFESVTGVRHLDGMARRAIPFDVASGQPHSALQDVDGGLAWIGVFAELMTSGECNQGLVKNPFVPPVDGVRAATVCHGAGSGQLVASHGSQRRIDHVSVPLND